MLSVNPCLLLQGMGRRRKRERDFQIGKKNSFTNNTRNSAKYTKPKLNFLDLG